MIYNVYYESLEQGIFYVKNNIINIDPEAEVNLVKKRQQKITSRGFSSQYSISMSKILLRKNPDVIISTIINDEEIPLIVVEFSTAVFTKDHEQQRADNFLIPINNPCIYIKVSPIDKDSGNHGGDTSYNYLEPFSLCLKKFDELTFHINWDVEDDKRRVLKHNNFKSLPENSNTFYKIFQSVYSAIIISQSKKWKEIFVSLIKKDSFFNPWVNSLISLNQFEDYRDINSSRTNFEVYNEKLKINDLFTLKINRMGHAMDPERGMLVYYSSFVCSSQTTVMSKFVFDPLNKSWYKDTPKQNEIYEQLKGKDNLSRFDLITFLVKGLSLINGADLIDLVTNSNKTLILIDDYIDNNYTRMNNSFRTIVDHSSILEITDGNSNDIHLKWTKTNRDFELSLLDKKTTLKNRLDLSEDDVTYITIHNVFKENGIKILSVSYPGAQSDTPILPEPDKGRRQKRIYIDNIGIKNDYLIFQENKGRFSKSHIKNDIDKISEFKTNHNYKIAVKKFANDLSLDFNELIIGVGFGNSSSMIKGLTDVGIDRVDYFLVISDDLQSWKIFSNTSEDVFKIKKGQINLPTTYEVSNFIEKRPLF
jgi:hypothetical protein